VCKLLSRWLLLELLLLELLLRLELLLELLLRLELLLGLELLLRLLELLGLELLLRLLELLGLELLLPLGLLQESWLDGLLGLLLCRTSEELLLLLGLESWLGRLSSRLTERLFLLEEGSVGGVSRVDEGIQVLASSAGRN